MTRGEVWTVAEGPEFSGKPRPAVVLQDDAFDATLSVAVCPVTSSDVDARSARPVLDPSIDNGLQLTSRLMVDKITTVSRAKLRRRIGRLLTDPRLDSYIAAAARLAHNAPSRALFASISLQIAP